LIVENVNKKFKATSTRAVEDICTGETEESMGWRSQEKLFKGKVTNALVFLKKQ